MTPSQPRTTTMIMLFCIIFLIGLLIWSVNQSAVLKVETLASASRLVELNAEVIALREEIAKINSGPVNSATSDDAGLHLAPRLAGQSMETGMQMEAGKVNAELPLPAVTQSDSAENMQLEDLPHPLQEPSGITEGNKAIARLDYDEAIENFTSVEEQAADYLSARMGVANAYFYSHQYAQAASEFTGILNLQPDSVEAAIGLANAHQRLGQREEQIAAYSQAIAVEPSQWLHYNSRATAFLMNGDNESAIEDFLQAGRLAAPLKTDQATALENIGLVYLRERQWPEAFQHANKVNQLDLQHSWNWLIRGIAAAKLKRNVDAYVSFDEWFKYKRSTDPYLLKQILPESIHAFVDVSAVGLAKLVDPPLGSGQACENDYQCKSSSCRPGAPLNKINYCVVEDKDCAAADSNGYLLGETVVVEDTRVRCYQPDSANARWTLDKRTTN